MDRIYRREVETGCDYTLPDYMGDIKRVLFSSARFVGAGKFIADDKVTLSGQMNYEVTYADSEGKLTAFTATSDVDLSETAEASGETDAMMFASPLSLSVRVIGPRKVALRSQVSANIVIAGADEIEVSGKAFESEEREDIETRSETVNAVSSRFITSGEREYAEEAERLVGVTGEEVEIISTSGKVYVSEATSERGAVRVKGEILISSIVRTASQPPFVIGKVIPFDETITVEDAEGTEDVIADAYLTSEVMGIAEDGDATVLTANAICEFSLMLSENKEIEIISDAYIVNGECSSEYEKMRYIEHIASQSAKDTVTLSASREELGIANVRDVLIMDAEPTVKEMKPMESGVVLEGVNRISGVACEISAENEVLYIPFKTETPFSVRVNCSCQMPEKASVWCQVRSGACEFVLDPGSISCSFDLYSHVIVGEEKSVERLSSFDRAEENAVSHNPSEIVVYYPDDDETLYAVSKLHRVRVADVAAVNGITVEASTAAEVTLNSLGVKRIILP